MNSPAEDRSFKSQQPSVPEAHDGLSDLPLPPVKDHVITLEHRYLSGLLINIKFDLSTEGIIQTIAVSQLQRNGEPTDAGFLLDHVPADLQIALSPDTVAKRSADEYLRYIVTTLDYYNRIQQQSGVESLNFRPLTAKVSKEETQSDQAASIRNAFNQRCAELGFELPSPTARLITGELTSLIQTSHQPSSLETWAHGIQQTRHIVFTRELLDNSYEKLSKLSIALSATDDTIDRYVRTEWVMCHDGKTSERVDRDSTHRYNYPTEAGALKFYSDSFKLIEILTIDGMSSAQTWLSQLGAGKIRTTRSEDTTRQQAQLESGILVELEPSHPRIELYRDPYASNTAVIIKPPYSSHTNQFTASEIHRLYEIITSKQGIDWSEFSTILHGQQLDIFFNPRAELSPGLTQFRQALEKDGRLKGLEWVQGSGALPRPARQLREFIEGREAVLIKRADDTIHGFSHLHVIFKGDTLDQIFIRSREEWVLDFQEFNLSPVDRRTQTDWLLKLTETFRNDPFQAIETLQKESRRHDSSFYGNPAPENVLLIKHMSAVYESALQYGCRTGVTSLAQLYMATFNPETNSARVNLMAKGRHLLSFEFDKDGVNHIQVSRCYFLNLWRPKLEARYEVAREDMKPAELFDLVVDHFASFTNLKRPFEGSGFKSVLQSIGTPVPPPSPS